MTSRRLQWLTASVAVALSATAFSAVAHAGNDNDVVDRAADECEMMSGAMGRMHGEMMSGGMGRMHGE